MSVNCMCALCVVLDDTEYCLSILIDVEFESYLKCKASFTSGRSPP